MAEPAGEKPTIFRKTALERLSSPERLDTLMRITRPREWVALLGLGIFIAAGLYWSFHGRLPQMVSGRGLVLTEGGLRVVQSHGNGVLYELSLKTGDLVADDSVVARVAQTELLDEIQEHEETLKRLTGRRENTLRYLESNLSVSAESLGAQKRQNARNVEATKERIAFLETREGRTREAFRLGLITEDPLQETVQKLADARADLEGYFAKDRDFAAQEQTQRNNRDERIFSDDREILETEQKLESLRLKLDLVSTVKSLHVGRVVEVVAKPGDLVSQGQAIAYLSPADVPLHVYLFIARGASGVTPGMKAQVELDAAKWEEWGYLKGTVVSVTPAPISRDAMMSLLHNESLANEFSAGGAPRMVEVELEKDPSTPSGYAWTTRAGPSLELHSGMRLAGRVITREERPIELVIPTLRRWFGF